MSVNMNDLPFEMLECILVFLEDKRLFLVERVCKKWQKCVLKLLGQKESLKHLDYYSDKFKDPTNGSIIINDFNIDILKKILVKCKNIKHLNFKDYKITSKIDPFNRSSNNLISIANLCPQLESIDLSYSSSQFWLPNYCTEELNEFGKIIGPQLIKCKLQKSLFRTLIFNYLKRIKDISFSSNTNEETKKLFNHLNIECQNLNILEWNSDAEDINYQDEHFIIVMQRIKHLKIDLPTLTRFKFNLDNLTELTVSKISWNVERNIEMSFCNLTKLNLIDFDECNLELIEKFKFPNLKHVYFSYLSCGGNFYQFPSSFIHQIKHINSFTFDCQHLTLSTIKQLKQLNDFVWLGIEVLEKQSFLDDFISNCFDVLSKHQSLQNIKLEFNDSNKLINISFYEELISLYHAKPNTRIIIKIPKCTSESLSESEADKKFYDYKKLFDDTKHLYKFNMELMFIDNL